MKKISMVMKLCLFLLLFTVYSVSARSVAQDIRLSMEKKSVSLIEVLDELSKKSNYEFFYNDTECKVYSGIGKCCVDGCFFDYPEK